MLTGYRVKRPSAFQHACHLFDTNACVRACRYWFVGSLNCTSASFGCLKHPARGGEHKTSCSEYVGCVVASCCCSALGARICVCVHANGGRQSCVALVSPPPGDRAQGRTLLRMLRKSTTNVQRRYDLAQLEVCSSILAGVC